MSFSNIVFPLLFIHYGYSSLSFFFSPLLCTSTSVYFMISFFVCLVIIGLDSLLNIVFCSIDSRFYARREYCTPVPSSGESLVWRVTAEDP